MQNKMTSAHTLGSTGAMACTLRGAVQPDDQDYEATSLSFQVVTIQCPACMVTLEKKKKERPPTTDAKTRES